MNIIAKDKHEVFIFLVFLAAFLIRIVYVFQVLEFPLTEYSVRSQTFDQYGFDTNALFISQGNWLGDGEAFEKEPLYSYFLALIYRIFGYSHFIVYIIQALLTSLGVILIFKITSHLFNRSVGYIASIILAFYSISIFYDALLLRASLVTFLNILLCYFLIKAYKDNSRLLYFISGVILGISMLTRHNMLYPFIAAFILLLPPCRAGLNLPYRVGSKNIKNVLIFTLGGLLVLLPVIARNYIVSGYKNIGISKEVNAFWVGNTHVSSGVDVDWTSQYHDLVQRSEGDARKMAYLFVNEIKKHPLEYLKLYGRKTWMFFNGYEAPSNTNYYLYREEFKTILRVPLFNFQLICAFGVLGLLLSLFGQKRPHIAYIFLVVLSISVILFHIQSRFRLPAVPFFIIFCSYAIYFIFDKIKKKAFMKSAVTIALLLVFYISIKPDLTYAGFRAKENKIRPNDRANLAVAYVDSYSKNPQNLKRALRQCDLAIKDARRFYIAYRIKGYIYFLKRKFSDSIYEYKKAIIYKNSDPYLYNELAGVYYEQHSFDKAYVYIKRALHFLPGNRVFEDNLKLMSRKI
ncbi:MAG: glycosyltransferase family 39 protein [Candidatus Omnitrophica bacterium]|nr:glycosyltransferase family 39 protein [Candidatus Omnitrophota bacterium]